MGGARRRSGGSTITQQLARTLFIQEHQKLVRRKAIEILLALWLDRVITKDRQLELYLGSVRFERGVYGVPRAMRLFLDELVTEPSLGQSFFLIERVSNVQSRLLGDKVAAMLQSAVEKRIIGNDDLAAAVDIYAKSVSAGKIVDKDGSNLSRLRARSTSCATSACS